MTDFETVPVGTMQRLRELEEERDAIWETLIRVADMLGINPEKARKEPGKPSDVYAAHIARLKAEWQAEALEYIVERWKTEWLAANLPRHIADRAAELRRQAEGET